MGEGWSNVPLEEVIHVNPSRRVVRGDETRYVGMADVPEWEKSIPAWSHRPYKSGSKFRNGDTLLARITPCLENGKTAFVDFLDGDEIAHGSTEFLVLAPADEQVIPVFAYLVAVSDDFRSHAISRMVGTSGRQRVPADAIREYSFPLPPLVVQRRIVDLIGHIGTALAAAELSRRELEEAARHVRATAFGSLTGESVPAGNMFDMLLGRQKSARQSVGDHVFPYIRAANIGVDAVDTSDAQRMNFEPAEQQKYALAPQDVLLVEGGSIGQASLWVGELPGFVGFDKHVIRIRARPNESTPAFALHWSHWARESGAFDEQATGLTIKALGYGRASRMPVPRLSVDEQTALTGPLEALRTTLATQRSHTSALRRFRGEVLTSLLAGDHDIPESYGRFLEERGAA